MAERMQTQFRKADLPPDVEALCSTVISAAIDVHRELGPGLLEVVYERAMAMELERRTIPFKRQVEMPVSYRGSVIGEHRVELLVGDKIVVELKAVVELLPLHDAQTLTYLRIGQFPLGLIINFHVPLMRFGLRRILNPRWRDLVVPSIRSAADLST